MVARRVRIPLEALLFPLLLAVAVAAHDANRWLETRQVEHIADGSVGALPNGAVLRVVSLGFERVVADLFWIRTVYYVGDESSSAAGWPAAERLADLVTDIDPHFDSAYVVMASVLNGLRREPDAAIRLLTKGTQNSRYWRIHFLLGFQYFMEKQDYVRGAECLQRAIALGGPTYLQFLVSRLYTSAGDPTTAMQFIALRLKNEETPAIREQLQQRLSDIWINRDLGLIDAAIESYTGKSHHPPKSVRALVDAGLLPALPRDGRAATDLPYEVLELKKPGRGQVLEPKKNSGGS
jgi:hypothetical protein